MKRGISLGLHAAVYAAMGYAVTGGTLRPDLWTAGFAIALIWISQIDFERFEIPDLGLLGLAGLGVAHLWIVPPREGLGAQVIAVLLWPGLMWLVGRVYARWRGMPGLGFGDVTLVAALGLWLDLQAGAFVLFSAALAGIAWGGLRPLWQRGEAAMLARSAIPFGPFLCFAAWVIHLRMSY